MAEPILLGITADPSVLEEEAFDQMRAAYAGWDAAQAGVLTRAIQVNAQTAADVAEALLDAGFEIFRRFGVTVVGIPADEDTAAIGSVTITATDDSGYTLPADTQLSGLNPAGERVGFATLADATIPNGSTSVAGVMVRAVEEGVTGNGVIGAGRMEDQITWASGVTFTSATTGGQEREDDDAYVARLGDEVRHNGRPTTPDDFAYRALRVPLTPSIARVVAIDGLDPVAGTEDNERTIALAGLNPDGTAWSAAAKGAVQQALAAQREVNWQLFTFDPSFNDVTVAYTATTWPGRDPAAVQDAINQAIEEYLSPLTWGTEPSGPAGGEGGWSNETVVGVLDLARAIRDAQGVRRLTALTINGGTADVTMTGYAPLPRLAALPDYATTPRVTAPVA